MFRLCIAESIQTTRAKQAEQVDQLDASIDETANNSSDLMLVLANMVVGLSLELHAANIMVSYCSYVCDGCSGPLHTHTLL